jgi:hypothetical protein
LNGYETVSDGAIAGIVIAHFGAFVIAGLLINLYYRPQFKEIDAWRRERDEARHLPSGRPKPGRAGPAELGDTGTAELEQADPAELPDRPVFFEAQNGERFEMAMPELELDEGGKFSRREKRLASV